MQRLKAQGIEDLSVHVLRQKWLLPSLEEKKLLRLNHRAYVLIREVLISSFGKQWMFARTVLPQQVLTGKERQLAHLKNRSLGSVLFKNSRWLRSEFEATSLPSEAINLTIKSEKLWARRSTFTLKKSKVLKSLMLLEVFLPDIYAN